MQLINRRMTRKEMFELYPNEWIAFGDEEDGFYSEKEGTEHFTALLLFICNSQKEAIAVPFKGNGYTVNSRGVINSRWWNDDEEEYDEWFTYDIAGIEEKQNA